MGSRKIIEHEQQAETLRQRIEEGAATSAQCYAQQKLVLTSIGGAGKDATPPPEPADLAVGIEKMQQAYTGFFSGPESGALPL